MRALIFPSAAQMLRTLVCWNQQRSTLLALPRSAYPLRDRQGCWALPMRQDSETGWAPMEALVEMSGVTMDERITEEALGAPEPLDHLVHHLLEKVQPSNSIVNQPMPRRYILGCRSRASATVVGKALFAAKTTGLRLVPVADNPSGFPYFWMVEHPPKLGAIDDDVRHGPPGWEAMSLANCVWWGIERSLVDAEPVYLEYPWLPVTDIDEIARLLGQDGSTPRQICLVSAVRPGLIRLAASHDTLPDLTQVLPIEAPESIFAPALPPLDRKLSQLKLSLSLGHSRNRRRLEKETQRLKARRRALEEQLRAIRNQLTRGGSQSFAGDMGPQTRQPIPQHEADHREQEETGFYPHPLHVHHCHGPGYPLPLQALLLEMMNSPVELQNIFCARLNLPRSDENNVLRPSYVVTPGMAIGSLPLQQHMLSVRVEGYGPANTPADGKSYELLSEWAEHGLYLFVPAGRSLELKPEIKPGALAAEIIGNELLGDFRSFIGLLEEGPESKVKVTVISRSFFVPLPKALDVELSGVQPRLAPTVAPLLTAPHLTATVGARMADAYLPAALEEWNVVYASTDRLKAQMDACDKELAALQQRLNEARQRAHAVVGELDSWDRQERQIAQRFQAAINELGLQETVNSFKTLLAAQQQLQDARERLERASTPSHPRT